MDISQGNLLFILKQDGPLNFEQVARCSGAENERAKHELSKALTQLVREEKVVIVQQGSFDLPGFPEEHYA